MPQMYKYQDMIEVITKCSGRGSITLSPHASDHCCPSGRRGSSNCTCTKKEPFTTYSFNFP